MKNPKALSVMDSSLFIFNCSFLIFNLKQCPESTSTSPFARAVAYIAAFIQPRLSTCGATMCGRYAARPS